MKAVKLALGGKLHYLAFNGEAMFTIKENFGSAEALLDTIGLETKEAFHSLCEAVALLAEQGELARRDLNYTPERIYTAAEFRTLAAPSDIINMKQAIPQAITLGFGREVEVEAGDVDLTLAELDQKKTT